MRLFGRLDLRLVAAIVVALVLVAAYWGVVALSDDYYLFGASGSTYGRGADGLMVLYQYLGEIGMDVRQLQQFEELPDGTIVVAASEPLEREATASEGRLLGEWVEGGGRLVLVGPFARDVLRGFPVGASDRAAVGGRARLEPLQASAYFLGVEEVLVDDGRVLAEDGSWVTYLKDTSGQVLVSRTYGDGEIVWLSSILPCSNTGVLEADNGAFATMLLGAKGGPVHFDEFHHGYARGGGVWERLGSGGRGAVVLAAAALGVLIAGAARRLGPAIAPLPERPSRRGAYIGSLAELYRRAGARSTALTSLADGLRATLAARYGSVEAGLGRIEGAEEALRRAEELSSAGMDRSSFLEAARAIARIRREVEGRDQ